MLRKVEFAAGIIKDDTPLASEGGYIDSDKIRFRQGRAETIGGWTPAVGSTFSGVARGAHAWTDLDGNELAAGGTADKLYALSNGAISDVTPSYFSEGVLAYPFPRPSNQTTTFTPQDSDDKTYFSVSSASAINMTLGGSIPPSTLGWKVGVSFTGAGSLTVAVGSSANQRLNGGTSNITLASGDIATITIVGGVGTAFDPTLFVLERTSAVLHPFETTSGSAIVKVNHPEHGLVAGQSITFSNATAVGGITPSGTYTVTSVLSRDKYTITHGSSASSTASGGVRVDYRAAWTSGSVHGSSTTAGSSFTTSGDLPAFPFTTLTTLNEAAFPGGGGDYFLTQTNNLTEYTTTTSFNHRFDLGFYSAGYVTTPGWKIAIKNSGSAYHNVWLPFDSANYVGFFTGTNFDGTTLNDGGLLAITVPPGYYVVITFISGANTTSNPSQFSVSFTTPLTNPLETTSGSPLVLVNHVAHGFSVGQAVTFSGASAVGGITVNGAYAVTSVVSASQYTITNGSNATSTANGGGTVHWVATWTIPSSPLPTLPSVWSLDNFGETLLAVRRGGPLYQFQPAASYPELNSGTWAAGTGWSGGTATAGVASNYSQNVQGVVKAGYVYRVDFALTRTAGSIAFKVNCGDPAAVISVGDASEAISLSGSYSLLFVAPADPIDIVFSKDAAFAGSVTSISIKLENKAFIVKEAPRHIDVMWVDPARIVVCGGTFEADGDYNPTLIRWSDQENLRTWIPSEANLAGELPLSSGGRVVAAKVTRGQTIIGTDAGIHSMQFTGDSTAFAITQRGTGNAPMGRHAMTEQNGRVFWWSSNGNFYVYDGASAQPIPCRVRRDAFDNLAQFQQEKIFAWVNATFSEVWFHYPDSRDGLECSRVLVFNYEENHWATHAFARTSAIPSGIFDYPIMFSTSGDVFYHENGKSANGSALTGYLETAYFDVEDGGNLMVIKRIVPDFEDQSGNVTFTLKSKPFPNGSELTTGPFTATPTTQLLNIRCMGRQIKIRLDSSANPSFWRMGLLRLEADKSGALR